MRRSRRLGFSVWLAAASLTPAATASGAPTADEDARTQAKAINERALRQYNVGHYEQAIEGFAAAYELVGEPSLLYNIAQAHRKLGHSEEAIRFYRRFLDADPQSRNREAVEQRIAELTETLRAEPPPPAPPAAPAAQPAAPPAAEVRSPEAATVIRAPEAPPGRARVFVGGLAAWPFFARTQSTAPAWREGGMGGVSLGASLGRSLAPAWAWEAGLAASWIAVPYNEQRIGGQSANSAWWGAEARFGVRRQLGPWVSIAPGIGAGAQLWTGLGEDNPFAGSPGRAVLPSLSARIEAEAVSPSGWGLFLTPSAAVAFARGDVAKTMDRIVRIELLAGALHAF